MINFLLFSEKFLVIPIPIPMERAEDQILYKYVLKFSRKQTITSPEIGASHLP